MSFEFAFENKEAKTFLKQITKQVKGVSDRSKEYIGVLSPLVFADVIKHFQDQMGSKGKWAPWSDFYKQHMKEIGKSGNKILQDTGRLRGSFKPTNYRVQSDAILWYNNAKTKSGFPYAVAHNDGLKPMPQRDFMYLSDEAKEKIEEVTLAFLEDF